MYFSWRRAQNKTRIIEARRDTTKTIATKKNVFYSCRGNVHADALDVLRSRLLKVPEGLQRTFCKNGHAVPHAGRPSDPRFSPLSSNRKTGKNKNSKPFSSVNQGLPRIRSQLRFQAFLHVAAAGPVLLQTRKTSKNYENVRRAWFSPRLATPPELKLAAREGPDPSWSRAAF